MTKELYTLEKAAARLNVSLRTVHNYLKKGLLTRVMRDGHVCLPAAEVEDLLVESTFPTMNRANWIEMNARQKRLEERMATVTAILGLHNEPLRPNKENAVGLHSQANKAVAVGSWDPKEVDMWTDILGKIDEVTLSTIAVAATDIRPWFTYVSLCNELLGFVEAKYHKGEKTLALERQILKLEECRKHLRSVAVVWIETNRGTVSDVILKAMVPTSRQYGKQSSG